MHVHTHALNTAHTGTAPPPTYTYTRVQHNIQAGAQAPTAHARMCSRTPSYTDWYLSARTHKHFDTHLSALAFSQSYWGPAAAMVTALVAKNLSYPNLYSHTRLLSVNHINVRGVCAGLLPAVCHKNCSTRLRKDMQADFS